MNVFRLLVTFVLVAGLNGCTLLQKQVAIPGISQTQQPLYELKAWRLDGRVGVQTPKEGWSAHLFWEHEGRQDRLRLSGPFSQGAVSIILQDDLIYINEGNGKVEISHDPDAALRERLGFAVPLYSLRYWVLGLPSPGEEHVETPHEGGGSWGFSQQGWVLVFERYLNVREWVLPQKATIRGNEVKLKLIADDWVIP